MLRRKLEQDRKRANQHSFRSSPSSALVHTYFGPFSIISFLIGFGILLHALQWRYVNIELRIKSNLVLCCFILLAL